MHLFLTVNHLTLGKSPTWFFHANRPFSMKNFATNCKHFIVHYIGIIWLTRYFRCYSLIVFSLMSTNLMSVVRSSSPAVDWAGCNISVSTLPRVTRSRSYMGLLKSFTDFSSDWSLSWYRMATSTVSLSSATGRLSNLANATDRRRWFIRAIGTQFSYFGSLT